ncbi:MAG TPA: hypothetical protein VI386_29525 [Candidatus Sulfotelmatobacter sp.]
MKKTQDNPPSRSGRVALFISFMALVAVWLQAYYSRQTMRIDVRPWVFYKLTTAPTAELNKALAVDIEIMNHGKTPALQVVAKMSIAKVFYANYVGFDDRLRFQREFGFLSQGANTGNYSPIFWKVNTKYGATVKVLDDDDIKDFREGRAYVRTWGRIDYRDVLGFDHWTTFCDWKELGPEPADLKATTVRDCVEMNAVDPTPDLLNWH